MTHCSDKERMCVLCMLSNLSSFTLTGDGLCKTWSSLVETCQSGTQNSVLTLFCL